MRRAIALALLTLPMLMAQDRDWKYEEKETLRKSFNVSPGENVTRLSVDQSNGWIHITGGSGSAIQVVLQKEIRAASPGDLSQARTDVKYDMTQEANAVKLYEDGPFRSRNNNNEDRRKYNVRFDCEVQVPAGVTLDLHTMNGGIEVKNVAGDFKVHTMNGAVKMEGMGAAGSAETMNGAVEVAFARNPSRNASFKTMNGSIDLHFPSNPDADLQIKTMRGEVFSDFDVVTQPTVIKGGNTATAGKFIYRSGGDMKVRAGKGGPELSMETMNGSIRLHSKTK